MAPRLRENGQHFRTDSEGKVRIKRKGLFQRFFAEKGELFAHPNSDFKKDEIILPLKPNRRFQVRVTTADGKPAVNVPVALQTGKADFTFSQQVLHSDENGIAVFEGINELLQKVADYGNLYASPCYPWNDAKINEPHRMKLTEEILLSGETTLVLPATCEVTVNVLNPDGSPYQKEGFLLIDHNDKDQNWRYGLRTGQRIFDGVWTFPHLGTATDLIAEFRPKESRNSQNMEFRTSEFPGSGTTINITIQPSAFLIGKILDGDGKPITEHRLLIREDYDSTSGGGASNGRVTTDEAGNFR
ncbi:MAG: hypothetical protein H8E15_01635 [Planctomycetes bacterium]|nr:hypothetical protein [Planctomycetota bacterium]